MITTRIKPGRPANEVEIRRYECVECGEHYDTLPIGGGDRLDHQHKTDKAGAWWIVRRAA